MKRINVSIEPVAGENLQRLFDTINAQRASKGLEPVFMRAVIAACVNRVSAMHTVFLCGELINLSVENPNDEPGA